MFANDYKRIISKENSMFTVLLCSRRKTPNSRLKHQNKPKLKQFFKLTNKLDHCMVVQCNDPHNH